MIFIGPSICYQCSDTGVNPYSCPISVIMGSLTCTDVCRVHGTNGLTSHPKDETIMVKCLAQENKRSDRLDLGFDPTFWRHQNSSPMHYRDAWPRHSISSYISCLTYTDISESKLHHPIHFHNSGLVRICSFGSPEMHIWLTSSIAFFARWFINSWSACKKSVDMFVHVYVQQLSTSTSFCIL